MLPRSIVVILSLLLFVSSVSVFEAIFKVKPRIIDGEKAAAKEFPYIVSIRDAKVHKHFCGGALITQRNVLSAGHCLIGRRFQPDSIYIALGVFNRLDDGVRKNVKRITIHSGFNKTFMHNDISIITTYTKIDYTARIQPIALPIADVPEQGNLNAVGAGWGRIINTLRKVLLPDQLQYHKTTTISWVECAFRLTRLSVENPAAFKRVEMTFSENIVCTKNPIGRGSCNGDSGGPLVAKIDGLDRIIGISSWGIGCGDGYPDVYTNVFAYSDWIEEQMIDNEMQNRRK
ncbi:chymotrypsin-2-like [Sitodiplosis mosellana]|uniref:chymotrypsin-2-like n=1 Tax=Sitodiplosis mosellana TaxID=263140 RepID=UPI002443FEB4|nr:chymotrypsin-2-like [Sitodiplosis mosellana]